MSKKNIYCGVGKVPKGSKLGSMKECAEAKQIRRYGVEKIDDRILKIALNPKKRKLSASAQYNNVVLEVSKYKGRRSKLENLIKSHKMSKDPEGKKKAQKELAEVEAKLKPLFASMIDLKAKIKAEKKSSNTKANSRETPRKTYKKSSKNPSKKPSKKYSKKN